MINLTHARVTTRERVLRWSLPVRWATFLVLWSSLSFGGTCLMALFLR
jgi:hypothetical protein